MLHSQAQQSATQRGGAQSSILLERLVVVVASKIESCCLLVSKPAVVEAPAALGSQGHANSKGGDGFVGSTKLVSAAALVVVGPQIVGPKRYRPLKIGSRLRHIAGQEQRSAQCVVLPCTPRLKILCLPPGFLGKVGQSQRSGVLLALLAKDATRSAQSLRLIEDAERFLPHCDEITFFCQPCAQVRPENSQIEQVVSQKLLSRPAPWKELGKRCSHLP